MKVRRDTLRYWLIARIWWRHPNRRVRFGVRLTTGWLLLCVVVYVVLSKGPFVRLEPNHWGDVAAGIAAPVAFLWLVLTYLQQGEELKLQRKELSLQRRETARLANETQRQAASIEATEQHARRDTFMRFHELVLDQLNQRARVVCRRMAQHFGDQIRLDTSYAIHLGLDPRSSDPMIELDRVLATLLSGVRRNELEARVRSWALQEPDVRQTIDEFVRLADMAKQEALEVGFDALFGNADYIRLANRLRMHRLVNSAGDG